MIRIAALLTCFNRREKTLACLSRLLACQWPEGGLPDIFLVDDGCTDGTAEAVRAAYPQAHVLAGDGNLYWNGGMRKAFLAAREQDYDFYLWLNDDTMLLPDAPARLFAAQDAMQASHGRLGIAVGNTCDAETGALTYGGLARRNWLRAMNFVRMVPGEEAQSCDTMNGNCVLIHCGVADAIGVNDEGFSHGLGDIDYGLRARRAGFPLWMTAGFVGHCSNNSLRGSYFDRSLSLAQRWKKITDRKGLPPGQWRLLSRRHGGILWPLHSVWPYVSLFSGHVLARVIGR